MIRRLLKMAVLGVAFVLLAGASAYFTMSFIIKGEDRVVVPDLTGKDVVRILESLTQLGLNTKVKGSEHSDQVPANHVLSQDPAPGTEIKKGRDIRIVLSKGPKTLIAPNLKGIPSRQARIILEQNGLCAGNVSKAHFRDVPGDAVWAQFPEGGTELMQGECMDLLVSLGPSPRALKMPDLRGLSYPEAVRVVQRMNLTPGQTQTAEDPGQAADTVLAQDPPAGHRVPEGQAVKMTRNLKADARKTGPGSAAKGVTLFKYRIKDGFLKSRIKLKFDGYGLSGEMIDAYLDPGEEVMLLIPEDASATVWLYEDDVLVVSRKFNP